MMEFTINVPKIVEIDFDDLFESVKYKIQDSCAVDMDCNYNDVPDSFVKEITKEFLKWTLEEIENWKH